MKREPQTRADLLAALSSVRNLQQNWMNNHANGNGNGNGFVNGTQRRLLPTHYEDEEHNNSHGGYVSDSISSVDSNSMSYYSNPSSSMAKSKSSSQSGKYSSRERGGGSYRSIQSGGSSVNSGNSRDSQSSFKRQGSFGQGTLCEGMTLKRVLLWFTTLSIVMKLHSTFFHSPVNINLEHGIAAGGSSEAATVALKGFNSEEVEGEGGGGGSSSMMMDIDPASVHAKTHMLNERDDGDNEENNANSNPAGGGAASNNNNNPQQSQNWDDDESPSIVKAIDSGPELTGLQGQIYQFHPEIAESGHSYYQALSSPRFQWNIAPYRWPSCPSGSDTFLGDTGFVFHEPDPNDHSLIKSKHLRFRIQRRADRECLWNHSKSCLAGGNLIMNFGKTSTDILYPGDYSLKTNDGVIRIVAYNTNRACVRKGHEGSNVAGNDGEAAAAANFNGRVEDAENFVVKQPLDYLRQSISHTADPEKCRAWIDERDTDGDDDVFHFNSDAATVHIDTPWMQIVLQLQQNKVATAATCVYASMNVYVADMIPLLVKNGFGGVLGEAALARLKEMEPIRRGVPHGFWDTEEHRVEDVFGTKERRLGGSGSGGGSSVVSQTSRKLLWSWGGSLKLHREQNGV